MATIKQYPVNVFLNYNYEVIYQKCYFFYLYLSFKKQFFLLMYGERWHREIFLPQVSKLIINSFFTANDDCFRQTLFVILSQHFACNIPFSFRRRMENLPRWCIISLVVPFCLEY